MCNPVSDHRTDFCVCLEGQKRGNRWQNSDRLNVHEMWLAAAINQMGQKNPCNPIIGVYASLTEKLLLERRPDLFSFLRLFQQTSKQRPMAMVRQTSQLFALETSWAGRRRRRKFWNVYQGLSYYPVGRSWQRKICSKVLHQNSVDVRKVFQFVVVLLKTRSKDNGKPFMPSSFCLESSRKQTNKIWKVWTTINTVTSPRLSLIPIKRLRDYCMTPKCLIPDEG